MNKVMEKIRKILFSTSRKRIFFTVIVVALALILAYFSQEIVFYDMDTSAAAYNIQFKTEEKMSENTPIELQYDGDTIWVFTDGSVEQEEIVVYASTRFGTAALTEENMAKMDETFLGSFSVAYPKQIYDIDADGINENVFYYAKTDLRDIQSNSGATPVFRDKKITMDVGMDSFESLFIYFQTKPLAEREVTVMLNDGSSFTSTTDSAGYITGLAINQIRAGVTIMYAPNGLNTYIVKYMPETTQTSLQSLLPLIILVILTVSTIALCVLLRAAMKKRSNKRDYTFKTKTRKTYKPGFVIARWVIMIGSFVLLTWAGSWLGYWIEELYIPVLSCSKYN